MKSVAGLERNEESGWNGVIEDGSSSSDMECEVENDVNVGGEKGVDELRISDGVTWPLRISVSCPIHWRREEKRVDRLIT